MDLKLRETFSVSNDDNIVECNSARFDANDVIVRQVASVNGANNTSCTSKSCHQTIVTPYSTDSGSNLRTYLKLNYLQLETISYQTYLKANQWIKHSCMLVHDKQNSAHLTGAIFVGGKTGVLRLGITSH